MFNHLSEPQREQIVGVISTLVPNAAKACGLEGDLDTYSMDFWLNKGPYHRWDQTGDLNGAGWKIITQLKMKIEWSPTRLGKAPNMVTATVSKTGRLAKNYYGAFALRDAGNSEELALYMAALICAASVGKDMP